MLPCPAPVKSTTNEAADKSKIDIGLQSPVLYSNVVPFFPAKTYNYPMATSFARAKTATRSLLQRVEPHMNDVSVLQTLGVFLPAALRALDTIELFGAEITSSFELYISTCAKLAERIGTMEDSQGERAWTDVTIDEESWHGYTKTMQSCINTLQARGRVQKGGKAISNFRPREVGQNLR